MSPLRALWSKFHVCASSSADAKLLPSERERGKRDRERERQRETENDVSESPFVPLLLCWHTGFHDRRKERAAVQN